MGVNLIKDGLTAHFGLSELGCRGDLELSPEMVDFFVNVAEPFRAWYNRPININRCWCAPKHNTEVGGVSTSLHLRGMAIDFNLPKEFAGFTRQRQDQFLLNMRAKWCALCAKAGGHGQVIFYNGYVHMGLSYNRPYFADKRGK